MSVLIPTPLDQAKLIFHQLSPPRIRGRFNGIKSGFAISGLKNQLEEFIHSASVTSDESHLCQKAITILDRAANFRQALIDQPITKCTEIMQQQINGLTAGSEAVFPLRRQGQLKGHAFIVTVRKENNNSLTMHLINTGEGTKKHAPLIRLNPRYRHSIQALKWENLFSIPPILCGQLIQHATGALQSHSMKPIYKLLNSTLPTKAIRAFWHKKQRAGTCAYKSLSVWLHHFLQNETLYLRFKLHMLEQNQKLLEEDSLVREAFESYSLSRSCWKVEGEETLDYIEEALEAKIERVRDKMLKQSG